MKISFRLLFLFLLLGGVLSSCEQCGDITITGPTTEDAEWLVYRQNDTIRFVTETNTPVTYVRTGIFAQNLPGEGYTATDECVENVNVQIRTIIDDIENVQPFMGTRILTKPDELVMEVGVENLGVWEIDEQSPSFATTTVNGKEYQNVFEVITNNTAASAVKRILFNKEFGFLQVEFNGGKKLIRVP